MTSEITLDPYVIAVRKYKPGYCEHCDGGEQPVRHDYLRGDVCQHCDLVLDEMETEAAKRRPQA